jgi:heat shock protein HtpX
MNSSKLNATRSTHRAQAVLLLVSLAAVPGTVAWMLAGVWAAVGVMVAIAAVAARNPLASPDWVVRLLRGRWLSPATSPGLYRLVGRLSRRAGLVQVPRLFLLPGADANAVAVGSPQNAAIGLSRGLLAALPAEEVEAVMAHEISHIRNNDILWMALAQLCGRATHTLSLVGQLLLLLALPAFLSGSATASWPLVLILLAASPGVNLLLTLAFSRTREYTADLEAAALTGGPRALASALARIERLAGSRWLHWLPVPGQTASPLLRTHPPTDERIRRLLAVGSPLAGGSWVGGARTTAAF